MRRQYQSAGILLQLKALLKYQHLIIVKGDCYGLLFSFR